MQGFNSCDFSGQQRPSPHRLPDYSRAWSNPAPLIPLEQGREFDGRLPSVNLHPVIAPAPIAVQVQFGGYADLQLQSEVKLPEPWEYLQS